VDNGDSDGLVRVFMCIPRIYSNIIYVD